jgi:nicotinate-nucleotide adenylyltransferase
LLFSGGGAYGGAAAERIMKNENKPTFRHWFLKHLPEYLLCHRPILLLMRLVLGRPLRIAILGGTFDPPQRAHLAVARRAVSRADLDLDIVLLVVSGDPVLKSNVSPAAIRYEMVRAAVKNENKIRASKLEMNNGKSYTVVTLRRLKKLLGADSELNFIFGSDKIAELPTWDHAAEVVSLCRLLIVPRDSGTNDPAQFIARLIHQAMPDASYTVMAGKPLPDSSTEVRRRRGLGQPIDHLLPEGIPEIMEIIEREGLYLNGDQHQIAQPTSLEPKKRKIER